MTGKRNASIDKIIKGQQRRLGKENIDTDLMRQQLETLIGAAQRDGRINESRASR